jgi:hypothetical protein
MAVPAGTIVKNSAGAYFLIETSSKRQLPDQGTLTALTLGIPLNAATVTDAALAAITTGPAFTSIAAYVTANPRVQTTVQRIVMGMAPTGLQNLAGGMMTIVEAAAALYADAIANPAGWAAPIVGASKKAPLPSTFAGTATQVVVKLLNNLLNKLLNSALSDTQTSGVGESVGGAANDADSTDDPSDPLPKDSGEKEDPKEDGDKEQGEKEAGEKDDGEKDSGEKEAGDKDGEKDAGDKDQKDDKEQEKDDKDDEKDPNEDGGDDGGDFDEAVKTPGKKASASGAPAAKAGSPARSGWDGFSA